MGIPDRVYIMSSRDRIAGKVDLIALQSSESLVRINFLYYEGEPGKDQHSRQISRFHPHQCNGDEKKLAEVWERQGLVHNADSWIHMTNKICNRERSRKEE
jgi:hypothetical protein